MANVLPSQIVESGQKGRRKKRNKIASASIRSAAERRKERRRRSRRQFWKRSNVGGTKVPQWLRPCESERPDGAGMQRRVRPTQPLADFQLVYADQLLNKWTLTAGGHGGFLSTNSCHKGCFTHLQKPFYQLLHHWTHTAFCSVYLSRRSIVPGRLIVA